MRLSITICGKFNLIFCLKLATLFIELRGIMKFSSYLIWLFEILNIAFYGVVGNIANKSAMFSKQSLIKL